jgi:hypothetical protein
MLLESLTISRRYCGPVNSGNGGYVCGRLARHIEGAATVRLFLPPPLETELRLENAAGAVQLLHEGKLIAEGRSEEFDLTTPAPLSFADAQEGSRSYSGFSSHRFPSCFVCGPRRKESDGMRIFPGPVKGRQLVAAPWIADASLAIDASIPAEYLWAALDCPGAFAVLPVPPGMTVVLGELSARIVGVVRPGEQYVVTAWPINHAGRKRIAGSAVYTQTGDIIATGRATWIEVSENAFPAEKA